MSSILYQLAQTTYPNLDPTSREVLVTLCRYADPDGKLIITRRNILAHVNVSYPTLSRKLRKLELAKLIHRQTRPGWPSVFTVNAPQIIDDARADILAGSISDHKR